MVNIRLRISMRVLCALPALVGMSAQPLLASENNNHADYNSVCQQYKSAFQKNKTLNITYTELPEIISEERFWSLVWKGLVIPIPILNYHTIRYFSSGSIVLKSDDGSSVLIGQDSNSLIDAPILDTEALSITEKDLGISSAVRNSRAGAISEKVGVDIGEVIKSKNIRALDMFKIIYGISPNDVTCQERYAEIDSFLLSMLILKSIDPPFVRLSASHQLDNMRTGLINIYLGENEVLFIIMLGDPDDPDKYYQINYKRPMRALNTSLPFMLGKAKAVGDIESPVWLILLNEAIRDDDADSLSRFKAEARSHGINVE